MERTIKSFWKQSIVLLAVVILTACSTTKPSSQTRYAVEWHRVLKTEAWKNALENNPSRPASADQDFYASTDKLVAIDNYSGKNVDSESSFDAKYDILARRAYVKIIAQAKQADTRLEREYVLRNAAALKKGKKRSKEFDRKLELVNRRYHAHRKMLEGLKSWNIFSEYGTNDLDFFKAENERAVKKMVKSGKSDLVIINYLIYKLADLYHFES